LTIRVALSRASHSSKFGTTALAAANTSTLHCAGVSGSCLKQRAYELAGIADSGVNLFGARHAFDPSTNMLFLLKRPARPQFRGHLRCDCPFVFCCPPIGGEGLELFDPGSVAFPFSGFDFSVELLQQFNLRAMVNRHSVACKPFNRSDETAFNKNPPETYRAKLLDAPLAIDHDAPSTLICKTSGSRSMFVMGILRTRGSWLT
jgi:hypothetical protein